MKPTTTESLLVEKKSGLIISGVRTTRSPAAQTGYIEARVGPRLKAAAQAVAEREGTTLSKVLRECLEDYVAGSVQFCPEGGHSRESHDASLARLRRLTAANHNILLDLRQVAVSRPDAPLVAAAITALQEELLETSRAIFKALSRNRHVS